MYLKCIELNKNYSSAYFNSANRYSQLGQYEKARINYRKYAELSTEKLKISDGYFFEGVSLIRLKKHNIARDSFVKGNI